MRTEIGHCKRMEELKDLRTELTEEIEAASLLLDDRLYAMKSYYDLVTAIGYAKVVLSQTEADDTAMEEALESLHGAIDGMELREEQIEEAEEAPKKKNLTPLLVAGAFCGGLLLGKLVSKKGKKRK